MRSKVSSFERGFYTFGLGQRGKSPFTPYEHLNSGDSISDGLALLGQRNSEQPDDRKIGATESYATNRQNHEWLLARRQ